MVRHPDAVGLEERVRGLPEPGQRVRPADPPGPGRRRRDDRLERPRPAAGTAGPRGGGRPRRREWPRPRAARRGAALRGLRRPAATMPGPEEAIRVQTREAYPLRHPRAPRCCPAPVLLPAPRTRRARRFLRAGGHAAHLQLIRDPRRSPRRPGTVTRWRTGPRQRLTDRVAPFSIVFPGRPPQILPRSAAARLFSSSVCRPRACAGGSRGQPGGEQAVSLR